MIRITKGQNSVVYLTLTEKQTIEAPNYLFWFQQRSTNQEVAFVVLNEDDESEYKDRVNKFTITVNDHFLNKNAGQWLYRIYEQASAVNTDPDGLNLLESGLMELIDTEEDYFEQHDTNNEFIIRE